MCSLEPLVWAPKNYKKKKPISFGSCRPTTMWPFLHAESEMFFLSFSFFFKPMSESCVLVVPALLLLPLLLFLLFSSRWELRRKPRFRVPDSCGSETLTRSPWFCQRLFSARCLPAAVAAFSLRFRENELLAFCAISLCTDTCSFSLRALRNFTKSVGQISLRLVVSLPNEKLPSCLLTRLVETDSALLLQSVTVWKCVYVCVSDHSSLPDRLSDRFYFIPDILAAKAKVYSI